MAWTARPVRRTPAARTPASSLFELRQPVEQLQRLRQRDQARAHGLQRERRLRQPDEHVRERQVRGHARGIDEYRTTPRADRLTILAGAVIGPALQESGDAVARIEAQHGVE